LVLLAALSIFMGMSVYDHRQKAGCVEPDEDELEGADPNIKTWQIVVFLCMGIIGLPVGAHILVEYSVSIATGFGISDTVIGLTLVAIGTSLPELATSVMAAVRRQADVAIGNVIGSNIFNLLGIIGVTAVIGRIPVDPALLRFDIWVMLGASLFLVPVVFFVWRIGRGVGALFCALYAAYLFVLF
jgi:cation:H+ antiporter